MVNLPRSGFPIIALPAVHAFMLNNSVDGVYSKGLKPIMKAVGKSQHTVSKCLRLLEDRNYIATTRHGHHGSRHTLLKREVCCG